MNYGRLLCIIWSALEGSAQRFKQRRSIRVFLYTVPLSQRQLSYNCRVPGTPPPLLSLGSSILITVQQPLIGLCVSVLFYASLHLLLSLVFEPLTSQRSCSHILTPLHPWVRDIHTRHPNHPATPPQTHLLITLFGLLGFLSLCLGLPSSIFRPLPSFSYFPATFLCPCF